MENLHDSPHETVVARNGPRHLGRRAVGLRQTGPATWAPRGADDLLVDAGGRKDASWGGGT